MISVEIPEFHVINNFIKKKSDKDIIQKESHKTDRVIIIEVDYDLLSFFFPFQT